MLGNRSRRQRVLPHGDRSMPDFPWATDLDPETTLAWDAPTRAVSSLPCWTQAP